MSEQGPTLTVAPIWRDRLHYGTVLPCLLIGGAGAMVLFVPPPPTLPAAALMYAMFGLAMLTGAGFALTAWRARLMISPAGLLVRTALREQLLPWDAVERVEVGRPYRYAGRGSRGVRWRALRVHVRGERVPVILAATNRPRRRMPELVDAIERVLVSYGHRVHEQGARRAR